MSGLMARIRSRRAEGPQTAAAEGDAPPVEAPATAGGGSEPPTAAPDAAAAPPPEEATAVAPAVTVEPADAAAATPTAVVTDVPAGAEPATNGPSFRDRGRMRRRLRYLRRVRELAFRDLGGLVFDLDRFGRDRPDLVRGKLDALGAIDRELRALETALHDERPVEELHEPGIAVCPSCGTIHGTDAGFCPGCGRPAGTAEAPAAG